jgi:ribonuclease-3
MDGGGDALEKLQERIGYRFCRPRLLREALTHRSFVNEAPVQDIGDNQRLEFFGDAILGFMVSALLYARFPHSREGELTRLRASLVQEERLAGIAASLDLGAFLRLGRGEERAGGRSRRSLLADAYEALVAAVFLDGGEAAARCLVEHHFLPLMDAQRLEGGSEDCKTLLQEQVQARGSSPPVYRVRETCGPSHAPLFLVDVLVGGVVVGSGEGRSKKDAEQAAARDALAP